MARRAAARRRELKAADPLSDLVRRSPVLTPEQKRHWLKLLPSLAEDHRQRLQQILHDAEAEIRGLHPA